ncbi:MAG: aminotransferase class V-fold PLP-dependent enzyme [Pseudomonadota bacterium]
MRAFSDDLMGEVRGRFAHVDACPITGPRVFFENAGGALTLKSVVETTARYAAIPDNQGRDNPMSAALMGTIARAREDTRAFLGARGGQVFFGESGTEVIFRMVRTACLAARGGAAIGTTLEHPASRSALARYGAEAEMDLIAVPHDNATGTAAADAYARAMRPDVRVATVVHTSPVTGMAVDVAAVARAIRAQAPDCVIIVDGIQHAAHGGVGLAQLNVDGYALSPYKVFSRHGYGIGWISDRLQALPHDGLVGGPPDTWELGTRDTGAYATWSDVVDYLRWLGDQADGAGGLAAASRMIRDHEAALCHAMVHGIGNRAGLAAMAGVTILGGPDNPAREGLVALTVEGMTGQEVVAALGDRGIRTHVRKADHYSGNILGPLGLETCVRVSMAHYNTLDEVRDFLVAMEPIA